jgi:hypothetical protein
MERQILQEIKETLNKLIDYHDATSTTASSNTDTTTSTATDQRKERKTTQVMNETSDGGFYDT